MENNLYCDGCARHCPADDPQCGRGRAARPPYPPEGAWEGPPFPEGRRPHRHSDGPSGPWGWEGRRPGGPEGHRPPHPHGPPPMEDDGSLTALFQRCAHTLFRPGPHGDSQRRVLRILSWRDEMSQRELQDHLRVQPGSLSELLSKLESKGLVVRERSGDDRRKVTLRLTEAGQEAAQAIPGPGDRDARFSALTQEEQDQLRALLRKLLDQSAPSDGER